MQVLTKEGGELVPNLYCIGDANGKLMLAHAASAHGVRCATRYPHNAYASCIPRGLYHFRLFRQSYIASHDFRIVCCYHVITTRYVRKCKDRLSVHNLIIINTNGPYIFGQSGMRNGGCACPAGIIAKAISARFCCPFCLRQILPAFTLYWFSWSQANSKR